MNVFRVQHTVVDWEAIETQFISPLYGQLFGTRRVITRLVGRVTMETSQRLGEMCISLCITEE